METRALKFLGGFIANKEFDNDPVICALRASHPKSGPDPLPGESMEDWGKRYMEYVRKKYNLMDGKK